MTTGGIASTSFSISILRFIHFLALSNAAATMAEEGTKSGERESKGATDPCTGEADPKHSEWFFDPDGDLEILSSDNVLFKVHAFHLQSAS